MKALPISTATTVIGFLEDVKKAIREEPRRLNMDCFIRAVNPEVEHNPACGTVGCIAGWIAILHGGNNRHADYPDTWAERILGRFNYHTAGWDGESGKYIFDSGDVIDNTDHAPGTQELADAVIARIDNFIKVNNISSTQLLAIPIEVPTNG